MTHNQSIVIILNSICDADYLNVTNLTEKIYKIQYPSGMGYFRPDLNFEGISEREIEVRGPLNTVVDICSKSQTSQKS